MRAHTYMHVHTHSHTRARTVFSLRLRYWSELIRCSRENGSMTPGGDAVSSRSRYFSVILTSVDTGCSKNDASARKFYSRGDL